MIGSFGPIISALIITNKYSGTKGIKILLRKLLIVKLDVRWYLFSFFLPLLIVVFVLVGLFVIFGTIRDFEFNSIGSLSAIFFTSIIICANEEISWRGFALPRLQKKNNALISSLIIGLFWGLLHFPLFLIQLERSGGLSLLIIVPGFVFMCILLSVIYTFQYNSTRGSVLLATIFHTSLNTSNELYRSPIHDYDNIALYLFLGFTFIISLLLILKFGSKNLSIQPRLTL